MDLVARVRVFAARHGLWAPEMPVIAAVSGGSDSVALARVLHELARAGHVRLAGLAHVHHHLRGPAADEDAAFVAALATALELPLFRRDVDVPAVARRIGRSVEVAAREARLGFFEALAAGTGAPRVALAHTRADQAETVLLRLARGAGPRGLAAMSPRTGHRVRPLLDVGREELRDWLRARGQAWREDDTNQDTTMARNLLRHEVMPRLARLNPAAEVALARAARIHAEDAALLEDLAAAEAERLLHIDGDRVRLDLCELRRLPDALARRVIRTALQQLEPERTPGWEETEAVLRLSGERWERGAVRVELFGDLAVLSSRRHSASAHRAETVAGPWTLDVPGVVRHPAGWWEIEATGPTRRIDAVPPSRGVGAAHAASPAADEAFPQGTRAVLDATVLGRHLTIRGWRPGDRVQPLGLGGRKKLQDVFVDRKVPRDERPHVPVVVDAHGRIVWVAGHVVGDPFRVKAHSDAVVVLTLRR